MLKKNIHFIFILLILLGISTVAFGQGNAGKIDFGSIEGSVYRNRYFGLKLTIPEKWQVQDDETKKQITAVGKKAIAGSNKELEKSLDASLLNSLNLLAVFKYPLNSGATANPSFACLAEKNNQLPSITSREYVLSMKSLMQQSKLPYKFEQAIYSQSLGGREFTVLPTQITFNGVLFYQNYYLTIMKGYALTFIVTYTTDEDLKSLEAVLKSVTFEE